MESIIIKPRDKAELKFYVELTKRLGTNVTTIDIDPDERLFYAMEQNKNTIVVEKSKVLETIQKILEK